MSKAPAYLVSAAGNPNFGDDLITVQWVRFLRERFPERVLFVDCVNPSNLSIILERLNLHQNVRPVDYLWRLANSTNSEFYNVLGVDIPALKAPVGERILSIWPFTELEEKPDVIHLLGGGYIADRWQHNLSLLPLTVWLKDLWACRLIGTGLGVDIASIAHRFDAAPLFRAFDYLSVRDEASFALIPSNANAFCVPDDVVLGLSVSQPNPPDDRLVLNLQRDGFSPDVFGSLSLKLLSIAQEWSGPIEVVSMYPGYDDLFPDFLKSMGLNFRKVTILEYLKRAVDGSGTAAGMAIGSRYHFHYLEAWWGTSGSFISSDSYYEKKHNAVTKLGSEWKIMPERGVSSPNIDRSSAVSVKAREAMFLHPVS